MTRMFGGKWLLAGITLMATMAMAQDKHLILQVLDGNSGKPLVNQHLTIYAGASPDAVLHRDMHFQAVTNHLGLASLKVPTAAAWLQVFPDWLTLCQDNPKSKSFSAEAIVSSGVAAPNICSSLVGKADPGQFVIFARPSTTKEDLLR